ncbi:MAG: hypothetical protein ACREQJ_02730, partial [Candidatus Binatia bacterium]
MVLRRSSFVLAGVAAFHVLVNVLTFGGDPGVHLVFAKHLVEGDPLQFNKGIFSSGETSPLYMS